MAEFQHAVFDVDNHYYETRDCFTRHIEPKLRDRAVHVREHGEREKTFVGDAPCLWLDAVQRSPRVLRAGRREEDHERQRARADRQRLTAIRQVVI